MSMTVMSTHVSQFRSITIQHVACSSVCDSRRALDQGKEPGKTRGNTKANLNHLHNFHNAIFQAQRCCRRRELPNMLISQLAPCMISHTPSSAVSPMAHVAVWPALNSEHAFYETPKPGSTAGTLKDEEFSPLLFSGTFFPRRATSPVVRRSP